MDKLPVTPLTHDDNSDVHPRKTLPESANLALSEEPTNPPLSTKSTLSWEQVLDSLCQLVTMLVSIAHQSFKVLHVTVYHAKFLWLLVCICCWVQYIAAIILISFRCRYTTTWWLLLDPGGHLYGNSWIIQAPSALQCVKLSDALRIRTWQNISHLMFLSKQTWTEWLTNSGWL